MINFIRQGDVPLKQVSRLPQGAKKIYTGKQFVVAEGEATGHNHTIVIDKPDTTFEVYEHSGQCYLKFGSSVTITHPEHKPLVITPGIYRQGEEREMDWFSLTTRKVLD